MTLQLTRCLSFKKLSRLALPMWLAVAALAAGHARADLQTAGPSAVAVGKQLNARDDGPLFVVDATGQISVSASLRTKGFLPNDPKIRVRVALMKPTSTGGLVTVQSKEVVLGHQN